MGKTNTDDLRSGSQHCRTRGERLRDVWNRIANAVDLDGTKWSEVMDLRARVMEFIQRGQPGDLRQADRLTAKAIYIIMGGKK